MFRVLLVLFVSLVAFVGCEPIEEGKGNPFQQPDSAFVLLIAVDPTVLARNKNIHEFTNNALDRYYEGRMGNDDDQVIIAALTGNGNSLIWQGTPLELREEFSTPEEFHAMIRSRTAPGEPLVHQNLIRALKYVRRNRSVAQGKAQSAALFLCDLMDRSGQTAEQELLQEFVSYMKDGGLIGFYYLSQDAYFRWDKLFEDAGYPWVPIDCDVHGRPKLPDFEDIRRPFK